MDPKQQIVRDHVEEISNKVVNEVVHEIIASHPNPALNSVHDTTLAKANRNVVERELDFSTMRQEYQVLKKKEVIEATLDAAALRQQLKNSRKKRDNESMEDGEISDGGKRKALPAEQPESKKARKKRLAQERERRDSSPVIEANRSTPMDQSHYQYPQMQAMPQMPTMPQMQVMPQFAQTSNAVNPMILLNFYMNQQIQLNQLMVSLSGQAFGQQTMPPPAADISNGLPMEVPNYQIPPQSPFNQSPFPTQPSQFPPMAYPA